MQLFIAPVVGLHFEEIHEKTDPQWHVKDSTVRIDKNTPVDTLERIQVSLGMSRFQLVIVYVLGLSHCVRGKRDYIIVL